MISHGFWPGGDWPVGGRVSEAVFYAYAIPEPEGFRTAKLSPPQARYDATLGEFVLPYEAVRTADDPDASADRVHGEQLSGRRRARPLGRRGAAPRRRGCSAGQGALGT